mgnify:CR=1 FL=1
MMKAQFLAPVMLTPEPEKDENGKIKDKATGTNLLTINNKEKYKIKIIDLMKQEELIVLNTIATAEGTIYEIIKK